MKCEIFILAQIREVNQNDSIGIYDYYCIIIIFFFRISRPSGFSNRNMYVYFRFVWMFTVHCSHISMILNDEPSAIHTQVFHGTNYMIIVLLIAKMGTGHRESDLIHAIEILLMWTLPNAVVNMELDICIYRSTLNTVQLNRYMYKLW